MIIQKGKTTWENLLTAQMSEHKTLLLLRIATQVAI